MSLKDWLPPPGAIPFFGLSRDTVPDAIGMSIAMSCDSRFDGLTYQQKLTAIELVAYDKRRTGTKGGRRMTVSEILAKVSIPT